MNDLNPPSSPLTLAAQINLRRYETFLATDLPKLIKPCLLTERAGTILRNFSLSLQALDMREGQWKLHEFKFFFSSCRHLFIDTEDGQEIHRRMKKITLNKPQAEIEIMGEDELEQYTEMRKLGLMRFDCPRVQQYIRLFQIILQREKVSDWLNKVTVQTFEFIAEMFSKLNAEKRVSLVTLKICFSPLDKPEQLSTFQSQHNFDRQCATCKTWQSTAHKLTEHEEKFFCDYTCQLTFKE